MNSNYQLFLKQVSASNIIVKEDYSLKNIAWCGFGGTCKLYLKIGDQESLIFALDALSNLKITFTVIGETTNIFFLEEVIYGVIIDISGLNTWTIKESTIFCEAGANLQLFLRKLYAQSITGFEGLEGIPGTLGGALFINAGAYGYSISDWLEEVHIYDTLERKRKVLTPIDCNYAYRSSIFKKNKHLVILSAKFNFKKGTIASIQAKVEKFHIARHSYQEMALPNLGSVFSSDTSVYDQFEKLDKSYKIKSKFITKLYYNKIARFIARRNPNRIRINNLLTSHFELYDIDSQIYSNKNLNTFAYKGYKPEEILKFYAHIKSFLKEGVFIENIILDANIEQNNIQNWSEVKSLISQLKSQD